MSASHAFFAVCPRGLEALMTDELRAIGASAIRADAGGASFTGELSVGYAANLHSRLASRVLWRVGSGAYHDEKSLYEVARNVAWERFMGPQQTLRVDLSASRSPLPSLEFATLKIKDAIVDRLRDTEGERPSIDRGNPDVRAFAYLDPAVCTLYVDLSGEPLFKRGWRKDKGEAPLKENLAAGLLALSGWTPDQPLLDPFCGSGTIVIEAACIAAHRAPGINRRFAFEHLRGFDSNAWRHLKDEARAAVKDDAAATLVGSDISTRVIEQARINAQLAGVDALLEDGRLRFIAGDARQIEAPSTQGVIVANPPYGEQSTPKSAPVAKMMSEIGDRLKQNFAGWEAWLLTSDRQLPKQMRLSETRKTVLFNGPLECRFFRFELVAGGYRPRARAAENPPELS